MRRIVRQHSKVLVKSHFSVVHDEPRSRQTGSIQEEERVCPGPCVRTLRRLSAPHSLRTNRATEQSGSWKHPYVNKSFSDPCSDCRTYRFLVTTLDSTIDLTCTPSRYNPSSRDCVEPQYLFVKICTRQIGGRSILIRRQKVL